MTGWTLLVASHAFAASVAIPLGGYQLFRRPRGDRRHRVVGRVWVAAMLYVSVTSFWLRDLRPGQLSFLHVLSVVTVVSVTLGVVAARRQDLARHRACMRGAWFGLLGAFVGAVAVPVRLIPRFALSEPGQAAAAALSVAATFVVVIALAIVTDRAPRSGAPATSRESQRELGRS
jgi:uncharacterized membrane protein